MKNEIESIAKETILTAQRNNTFIDYSKIYNLHKTHKVKVIIIISTKGISGKSTSGIQWIVNHLANDSNYSAVWLRNTEIASKNSKLEDSFKLAMINAGFEMTHWTVNKQGIFYKENLETNKFDKGICRVMFAFLNTYENFCSQNVMKATDIFFDEFIDAKFIMKNMSLAFNNLIKSLQRTNDAMIVMFANPHTNKNDLLVDSGLIEAINWESGETQINYIESLNTLFCYIGAYANSMFNEADKQLNKFLQYNEAVQSFNKGILTNPLKNVTPFAKLKTDSFIPLYKFHVRDNKDDTDFLVGKIDNTHIVKQLTIDEQPQLNTYAFRAVDLVPNGIYVSDVEYSHVSTLINAYKKNKIIFTNIFTMDIFKRIILPKLSILENINKLKYCR